MPTIPSVQIFIEIERPPLALKKNMLTEADERRMAVWLDSNPATRELLDWINKWGEAGGLNAPTVRADVADPFAASGQL